jgi:8-oxo-dGTP pyrophosphatase MutT (NUDIX family)
VSLDDLAEKLDAVDAPVREHEMPGDFAPAAVLVLILPGEVERILLIERAVTLRTHAGQLAFPGGKREHEDATLVDTALREASEEVGLGKGDAEVLGKLYPVPTPTKFVIHPFVGRARTGWKPRATSPEVARLVMPTMEELLDPSIHRVTGRGMWLGYAYEMHEFAIHDPPLWGASARMTWDLLQRLRS